MPGPRLRTCAAKWVSRHRHFYRWKAKYRGMKVSDAKRLWELETENRKLKQLLGQAQLDKAALKELLAINW